MPVRFAKAVLGVASVRTAAPVSALRSGCFAAYVQLPRHCATCDASPAAARAASTARPSGPGRDGTPCCETTWRWNGARPRDETQTTRK